MPTFDPEDNRNNSAASSPKWTKYASITEDVLFPSNRICRRIKCKGAGVLMLRETDGDPADPLEFTAGEVQDVQASGIFNADTTVTDIWVYF